MFKIKATGRSKRYSEQSLNQEKHHTSAMDDDKEEEQYVEVQVNQDDSKNNEERHKEQEVNDNVDQDDSDDNEERHKEEEVNDNAEEQMQPVDGEGLHPNDTMSSSSSMDKGCNVEKHPEQPHHHYHAGEQEREPEQEREREQQEQQGEHHESSHNFLERSAMRMARRPKTHFWIAFVITVALSAIAVFLGDFDITVNSVGWESRGTTISDRHAQLLLVRRNRERLLLGDGGDWDDLITNVQPGWNTFDDDNDRRRRHLSEFGQSSERLLRLDRLDEDDNRLKIALVNQTTTAQSFARRLQEAAEGGSSSGGGIPLVGCDLSWYTDGRMLMNKHMAPVWKTTNPSDSFLQSDVLFELCVSEENTQQFLERNNLCFGCNNGRCLPPFSIVLYARMTVPGGIFMDCRELSDAWSPLYRSQTEEEWKSCAEDVKEVSDIRDGLPDSCGDFFFPNLLDEFFDSTGVVQYTSSTFATSEEMLDELYDNLDHYDRGSDLVGGAYDTQNRAFSMKLQRSAVGSDMLLATMSAITTTVAMLIHTRSFFLTLVGLVQILLSFPTAYFVYNIIGRLEFFPFLNFIGVFVVFALGADHVFVAVDKWKNARLANPSATTEEVAAKALPDAASAMFLTTITTAAAFFSTGICAVAPIKLFAIFCGLLISLDYVMDVFLIFPSLCIYDNNRQRNNCCMAFGCCGGSRRGNEITKADSASTASAATDDPDGKPPLIRRILLLYYRGLDFLKWPLLVASIAALCACSFFATRLELPSSAEITLLRPEVEFERAHAWRSNLLSAVLANIRGSRADVIWGVKPADTGNHNNPESWTQLVLDDCFDPSTPAAQVYLRDFCPAMYAEDFANPVDTDYECPINRFDRWLGEQSNSPTTDRDDIYLSHCAGETGLPMEPRIFHQCITAWAQEEEEDSILARDGVVLVMFVRFQSRLRLDMSTSAMGEEWQLIDDWMDSIQTTGAPPEVSKAFFSSLYFWYYDTNYQMFQTALGSAAIALAVSAVVILISSRSVAMTIFSVLSIAYVLTSVTTMMVAIGWTLGFLESICFSILIGVSVDFVIHFSHAYTSPKGDVSRQERTRFALLSMGPSVLAAAVTTMAGAVVMLFTVIVFFQKFAMVLFFTIIQATIGSFVVFFAFTDCLGPSNPTFLFDRLAGFLKKSGPPAKESNPPKDSA